MADLRSSWSISLFIHLRKMTGQSQVSNIPNFWKFGLILDRYTPADATDVSWLDFLSNNPAPPISSVQKPPPPPMGESMSWERDKLPKADGTTTCGPSPGSDAADDGGASSPNRKSTKRPRLLWFLTSYHLFTDHHIMLYYMPIDHLA